MMTFKGRKMKLLATGLFSGITCVMCFASPTSAQSILVTNLADSGNGSLRAAIASANANPGADVIRFQSRLAGTITLTSGQMEITGTLVIDGPDALQITVSGNNASRIFKMGPGTEVAIDDLTFANSRNTIQDDIGIILTRGGAILNDGGTLRLTRVTMLNNVTIDNGSGSELSRVVSGGAVVNTGNAKLAATNCLFVGNTARGGTNYVFGGAIGSVTNSVAVIENCIFLGNTATSGGTSYGGAIGNFGGSQLTISGCTFGNNTACGTDTGEKAFGGAITTRPGTVVNSGSTTTIDKSLFIINYAIGAAGQAGQSGGDAGGGALSNVESTLTIGRSTFAGNQALGRSGGINGGSAFGGAIEATAVNDEAPPLTQISRCQFNGNIAQSGDGDTGSGGLAAGGAVYNAVGNMDLRQSTIVGNLAHDGHNGQGVGGGLYNLATVTADRQTNWMIVGNFASSSDDNVFGPVTIK